MYSVGDFMTRNLTTLPDDCHLLDAALLIRRTGKRHVPILNAKGKLVGIISDRDVSRLSPSMLSQVSPEEYNQVFESTPITMAMTKDPLTVRPDDDVQKAVELMFTKRISALPVVEDGALVGILTITDMLGLLNRLLSGEGPEANLS